MKQSFLTLLLLAGTMYGSAQAPIGGTVVYTRTSTYNFEPTGIDEWDAYAKTLPTEGKFEKVLSIPHQKALFFASYGKPPKPLLKSLYIDFQEEQRTALQEFMTREFLVESPLENRGWKLDPSRKKIGDYICMKATMNLEGDTVTAWFAPEISIPAGPAEYYGLPGVVLAVERLGETVLLATSIDLTSPPAELLVKPVAGKKTSPEAFERIVKEKTEEFKKVGPAEFK